jgi:hypothetical protein
MGIRMPGGLKYQVKTQVYQAGLVAGQNSVRRWFVFKFVADLSKSISDYLTLMRERSAHLEQQARNATLVAEYIADKFTPFKRTKEQIEKLEILVITHYFFIQESRKMTFLGVYKYPPGVEILSGELGCDEYYRYVENLPLKEKL